MSDKIKKVDESEMVEVKVLDTIHDESTDPEIADEVQRLQKTHNLDTNTTDVFANFTSAVLSTAPIIGPVIAEAFKSAIPNQRLDRVVEFMRIVEKKVVNLEHLVEKIRTPEGLDILEDVTYQSTRAMTDDRREDLANILVNGLTRDDLQHIEKKKLVSILGELNDIEVLHLKSAYLSLFDREKFKEFMEKHHDVIRPASSALGAPEGEAEYKMFQDSYKDTLNRFWLTENKEGAGSAYNKITPLGRLLIEYIEDPGDEIR